VGLRETLQEALVNANNKRHECQSALQNCDSDLVQAKTDLEKARERKALADEIHQTAITDYRTLFNHSNSQPEVAARVALQDEINRLALEQTTAQRDAIKAAETLRTAQQAVSKADQSRSVALTRVNQANEGWEEIRKQIDQLSVLNQDA
jgi:hypothetical protein